MFWMTILFQTSSGNFLFGYVSETTGVLLFGVCLIGATAGIRWFLKRHEETSNSKTKTKEVAKR